MSRKLWAILIIAIVIALVLPLSSLQRREIVLTETGSTLAYPVMEIWASEYSKLRPNVRILVASTGSGMGIAQAGEGTVDMGATDAYLTQEQIRRYGELVHIPIFIGEVAIVYNLPGIQQLNLTPELISGIYMGEISHWSDPRIRKLNPGIQLPDKPIIPIYRADSSGTTFLFSSWLNESARSWNLGYGTKLSWRVGVGGDGNQGVADLVKRTPYSIGYVGLAWAKLNNLQVARVENPASGEFVEPTLETSMNSARAALELGRIPGNFIGNGSKVPLFNIPERGCYPIVGFIYLLVRKDRIENDDQRALELREFLKWALTHGQEYISKVGYVPLPPEVSAEVIEMISR